MEVTTGTGPELVDPFFFMGADAARLMGAKAARSVEILASLLFMCPIAPDELDAAISGKGYLRLLLALGGLLQLPAEHQWPLGPASFSLKISVRIFCSFDPRVILSSHFTLNALPALFRVLGAFDCLPFPHLPAS